MVYFYLFGFFRSGINGIFPTGYYVIRPEIELAELTRPLKTFVPFFVFFLALFCFFSASMANKNGYVVEFVLLIMFVVCVSSQSEYDGTNLFFFFFLVFSLLFSTYLFP